MPPFSQDFDVISKKEKKKVFGLHTLISQCHFDGPSAGPPWSQWAPGSLCPPASPSRRPWWLCSVNKHTKLIGCCRIVRYRIIQFNDVDWYIDEVEFKVCTRKQTILFEIGSRITESDKTITGSKLPTCGLILRCFPFYPNLKQWAKCFVGCCKRSSVRGQISLFALCNSYASWNWMSSKQIVKF